VLRDAEGTAVDLSDVFPQSVELAPVRRWTRRPYFRIAVACTQEVARYFAPLMK
jgi:hypothetical protein